MNVGQRAGPGEFQEFRREYSLLIAGFVFFQLWGVSGFYIAHTTHKALRPFLRYSTNQGSNLFFDDFRDFSENLFIRKETGISRKQKLVLRKHSFVFRQKHMYLGKNHAPRKLLKLELFLPEY